MDEVPKLLPIWHEDVGESSRFSKDRLPDFGGIGINISQKENEFSHLIPKHTVDQVGYKAQVCALPFLPANETLATEEPCLDSLNASKENLKFFCLKLDLLRRSVKSVSNIKFSQEILSSYKLVKKMCRTGNYTKISLPEQIIDLAVMFPKVTKIPEGNLEYSGGCLASAKTSEENHILLYPTGKKLNKLALTVLEQNDELYSESNFNYLQSNTIKLKNGIIQQVKCAIDGYCYVRQHRNTHFVNFTDISKVSYENCLTKESVKNIGPSPYCPCEFVSIHENGKMELNNIDARKVLWTASSPFYSEILNVDIPLACGFGQHPKSILHLTENRLYSFDARFEEQEGSVIFSSDSYINENLISMKGSFLNPFHHFLCSTYHLFMCDERYPKKAVLKFSHLLKGSPLYCDVMTYNSMPESSDFMVLLGTQKSQELVSFAIRSKYSQIEQPISLSPPLFLSAPTDCVNSLKLHCINVDEDTRRRFLHPLVGVTSVPNNNSAFTAFQLNSLGDLFYQDFSLNSDLDSNVTERTHRVDMGCILTPPNRILPHLNYFTKDLPSRKLPMMDESMNDSNRINVGLMNILSQQANAKVSDACCVCQTYDLILNREITSSEICPSCGLGESESDSLLKAFNEMSLISGTTSEDSSQFDPLPFFQFSDMYSRKILEPWISGDIHDISTTQPNESDSEDDMGISAPTSSKSHSVISVPAKTLEYFDKSKISELSSSQLYSQSSLSVLEETTNNISLYSQGPNQEFIPSSQDVRPLVGETLHVPKKSKLLQKKKNTSSAGF